jgi:hypothetical protein
MTEKGLKQATGQAEACLLVMTNLRKEVDYINM